jgi:ketosteroid isomerase-like protein
VSVEANTAVVRRLWTLFQARDWDAAEALVHPDIVVDWPDTRERMRGRANFMAVQRNYPEPWGTIEIRRVIGRNDLVVAEIAVHDARGTTFAISFAELEAGRIVRAVEYWVDDDGAPPAWRAQWTERIAG